MSIQVIPACRRLLSPAAGLAAGLGLAVLLACLPARWGDVLRAGAATLLRPGQVGVAALRQQGNRALDRLRCHLQDADRMAELQHEVERLSRQNRRLLAELAAPTNRPPPATEDPQADRQSRLLRARCVPARVLGLQARSFLASLRLLDVGTRAGVRPDALVVEGPAVIDRGREAGLRGGRLVLRGRGVWGKVLAVGPYTSTVRTVCQPDYRDLVRVGTPTGPQGILEGTGEPVARIRLVEVTQPVSVGDPVYAAAVQGLLPAPLLYGRVARVHRPVGAAHWEIWMEPAVDAGSPERVAVLRTELNPLRVAKRPREIQ